MVKNLDRNTRAQYIVQVTLDTARFYSFPCCMLLSLAAVAIILLTLLAHCFPP